ncbi:MAG: response regulator transcription factor [Bacteroidales bacterium]|jgi:DNA-binding NarL/FixJ family response regulator|nr:response regulator transcription factor [Bacteroidales bacterium]MCK9498765.1 response regulator transcription factor [Bacteroidales bacterium]MDY0314303.1 response regulator transcription factor [Bacteroidales bacterium]
MTSNKNIYNVMIVDDHALFRDGLKLLLNSFPNFKVVAEASNGEEFLQTLELIPVDIVLLDIEMPILNGIEATKIAIKKQANLKIITLSMYGDEEYYYKMIEAGASGFLLKDSDIDEVHSALNAVVEGKSYFSQELLQNLINNLKNQDENTKETFDLSAREIEIIDLICQGLSNIEIGEKLFLSKRTVEKHRANILEKTNSKNTASLVMFAIKNKIVSI